MTVAIVFPIAPEETVLPIFLISHFTLTGGYGYTGVPYSPLVFRTICPSCLGITLIVVKYV